MLISQLVICRGNPLTHKLIHMFTPHTLLHVPQIGLRLETDNFPPLFCFNMSTLKIFRIYRLSEQ